MIFLNLYDLSGDKFDKAKRSENIQNLDLKQ